MNKRIALVRYQPDYFGSYGPALEQQGFEVFWINSNRSHTLHLTGKLNVPAARVLDTTVGFDPGGGDLEECRAELSVLETNGAPRIHDIILMDRVLRRKPYPFSLRYLRHLQRTLTAFLSSNGITLVTSGRDTALAMISMLVSRKLGIPWVVPTRLRIPQEMYGFCQTHETADMVRVRAVTDEDRAWARTFVQQFNGQVRPAMQRSARGFTDVVRFLPVHARVFRREVLASIPDRGNDYTRYTLPGLIRMYLTKRRNMLDYRLFPPYAKPHSGPYCIFGLHTQPESSIDVAGAFFSDQIALITTIARSLPVTHELYIKVHPTDADGNPLSFYRRIAKIAGVRLIDYSVDSRDLVGGAAIVFSLTGTIAYEAALLGKPVVTFGNNFFNSLPTVHYCDAPPRLPALVERLLRTVPSADTTERLVEAMADLKSRVFEGEVNRTHETTALSPRDLKSLQFAYDSLHRVLVSGSPVEETLVD